MNPKYRKNRTSRNRRDQSKFGSYGQKLFFPVKRYDKDGNLLEEVSVDDLMAKSPDTAKHKYEGSRKRKGGTTSSYSKLATELKKSDKNVRYSKHK